MIATGAFISALSPSLLGYVLGFLLIAGFDKMFNVYIRTIRQRVIPPQDFGKTVGVITLLNNMSQPLAGLLVALLAAPLGTQTVILILAVLTTILGTFALWWFAKARGPSPSLILEGPRSRKIELRRQACKHFPRKHTDHVRKEESAGSNS